MKLSKSSLLHAVSASSGSTATRGGSGGATAALESSRYSTARAAGAHSWITRPKRLRSQSRVKRSGQRSTSVSPSSRPSSVRNQASNAASPMRRPTAVRTTSHPPVVISSESPQPEPVLPASAACAERDSPTLRAAPQSRFTHRSAFASDLHARGLCAFARAMPDGGQVWRFALLFSARGPHVAAGTQRDAQAFTQRSETEWCFTLSTLRWKSRDLAIYREISVQRLRPFGKPRFCDSELEHALQELGARADRRSRAGSASRDRTVESERDRAREQDGSSVRMRSPRVSTLSGAVSRTSSSMLVSSFSRVASSAR
jgi:hypothetical protein